MIVGRKSKIFESNRKGKIGRVEELEDWTAWERDAPSIGNEIEPELGIPLREVTLARFRLRDARYENVRAFCRLATRQGPQFHHRVH